ncbi:hypothetical protein RSAG8_10866, partial [Rhizoctonia solani AG-8 WAC10335]
MTHSDIVHPRWGRPISQYPRSYTNEALAARLKAPIKAKERAASRTIALRTIEEICMLSEPALEAKVYADTVARITLSKLESILELTRFTSEYENLALPKLIAGGIELLSSVTPSPLAYEYGYLCFRTLVFALNACVLKYGGVWDETIARISSAPPSHRFPIFWDNSATLLIEEMIYYCGDMEVLSKTGPASPRRWLIPAFDPRKLDKLLSTLHSDQKNLLIALRDTGSLGLSALLFILKKHVENKRPYMSTSEYLEQAFLPYFRVLYRYQITLPDLGSERVVARTLCSENMMDLEDEYFIDLDDSRNLGDRIVENDVVGLILRLELVKSGPGPHDLEALGGIESDEHLSIIQIFLSLVAFLPPQSTTPASRIWDRPRLAEVFYASRRVGFKRSPSGTNGPQFHYTGLLRSDNLLFPPQASRKPIGRWYIHTPGA